MSCLWHIQDVKARPQSLGVTTQGPLYWRFVTKHTSGRRGRFGFLGPCGLCKFVVQRHKPSDWSILCWCFVISLHLLWCIRCARKSRYVHILIFLCRKNIYLYTLRLEGLLQMTKNRDIHACAGIGFLLMAFLISFVIGKIRSRWLLTSLCSGYKRSIFLTSHQKREFRVYCHFCINKSEHKKHYFSNK